jgi:hypothetical protein
MNFDSTVDNPFGERILDPLGVLGGKTAQAEVARISGQSFLSHVNHHKRERTNGLESR